MRTPSNARRERGATLGERGVALMEFLKGVAVVVIGTGLTVSLHRQHDVEELARSLVYGLHLAHHRQLTAVFLRAADRLEDTNLLVVAVFAGVYASMRFVEAYGLWRGRVWAEWFALISGAVYVPLELYEISRHPTVIKVSILAVNLAIVAYMALLRAHAAPVSRRIAV